jgi:hypothetical protein
MAASAGSPGKVYAAIALVMADLAKEGISKDRKNEQQKYKFRGIDDVYNALAPSLSRHKLVILPRVLSRTCEERATNSGGRMNYVTVEAEFDIVSGEDGSMHTVRTIGEAMDSADKATNKAMSAAFKYAAFQAFCIPTEGDNDADASTPQIAPKVATTTETGVKAAGPHPGTLVLKNEWEVHPNDPLLAEFKEAAKVAGLDFKDAAVSLAATGITTIETAIVALKHQKEAAGATQAA